MADLMEYKCPRCAGVLEFDSKTQRMKCPYCDSEFDTEELKPKDDVLDEAQPEQPQAAQQDGEQYTEADGMAIYTCKSCGGEIVADVTTGATQCPYCGNPVVMTGSFAGSLKPDCVIPFKLDKAAAKEALKAHMSKKRLLPKLFSSENHIDEIKGIYVPFWLFDSDVDADLWYKTTRVRNWSDADYQYTETSYFDVRRGGVIAFDNVPADGSSKMPDDLMESLEPFDFTEAVPFQTAYLSGYYADRYDVSAEDCTERIENRIRNSTAAAFRSTVNGYNSVNDAGGNINTHNAKPKYALFPVWLLNTTYRGERYTFAMNGQSGKFVGNMPMDMGRYWLWHFIYTLIFGAIGYGIYLLVQMM